MKKRIIIAVTLIASHLICVCLAFLAFAYAYSEFIARTQFETQCCNDITTNYSVLKAINSGNTERARIILENKIDGGLVGLSTYDDISEVKHKKLVKEAILMVKGYKLSQQRENEPSEIDDAITKSLSLVDETAEQSGSAPSGTGQ